jgi:hypothetical protein
VAQPSRRLCGKYAQPFALIVDAEPGRRLLLGIAAITVATGALQAAKPEMTLGPLRAQNTATTRHFFGTVGMFMVCTGGVLLQTLIRGPGDPDVVLWTAAQKLGAAAAGIGTRREVFAPDAIGVAGIDAVSGVVALDYWRRVR